MRIFTQRRRLTHLESELDSFAHRKTYQVAKPVEEKVKSILSAEEVKIFRKYLGRLAGTGCWHKVWGVDLSRSSTKDEICTKLNADPEFVRLFDELLAFDKFVNLLNDIKRIDSA